MSIVKTSPPPMTVGDYRNAALRHFNVCKVLWRYTQLPANSNLKKLPEEDVLKNIFYLTGYIAECAIKYRYLTDCHSLNDHNKEADWISKGAVVRRHFTFSPSPQSYKDKIWSEKTIQSLCASTIAKPLPTYLQTLGQGIPSSTTPTVEQIMQASWEPTIRYHYETNGLPIPPDKAHIEAFFLATKSLLHNLNIL